MTKKLFISIVFILFIASISFLLFIRRDIFVYDDKYGYIGVLFLCFLCNASILAPAPSLIVILSAANTLNPVFVAFVGSLGMTFGEMTGFFSGRAGRNLFEPSVKEAKIAAWIERYGAFAVFIFALIPAPFFDIAGLVSGYSGMNCIVFFVSCFIGKFIKALLYVFGEIYLLKFLKNF